MTDWSVWQQSWDDQQEWYLPDREERFRVMLDAVEAVVGDRPRVLDLACGTGSISARALRRFPDAVSTGVDLDPALLTIARGSFADHPRASFVAADLTDPDWTAALPHPSYDAVLTATALHWLREESLRALYGRLAQLVRPGGVFLNADHMPHERAPRINAAIRAFDEARQRREKERGRADWAEWWRSAAEAPELAAPTAERFRIFGDPSEGDHSDGQMFSIDWHVDALREAGFAEARPVWASPNDATVLALR
ncbi:class I SAM-dependent methyltransferase [Streptomyces profundus]|uniref:class I SAM-dependent methyltransferase n=1 Tax=Streptomyces profundus TaxID=2867410 RepID=UPI001D160BCD|nr:class I SAM-dependent methyltransferase [Streptomyces sp. MA3_2.13]UED84222.1 class I SAM-dependent methyltransferase [Streptomyces sp. MA3_2.13]